MGFKAVEFMRNSRKKIYQDTKDFSYNEQNEYYSKHSKYMLKEHITNHSSGQSTLRIKALK